MSDTFNSEKAPEPVGLYPHARRVGDLLFLSGVGPRERGTKEIPGVTLDSEGNIIAYNIEEQCRSVFKNVRLILEASGSSWDELVDVTVFLTNMKADFKTYNRIYAEYFKDNQPCRTTVEINSLPTPIAIELKCIATVKSEKPVSHEAKASETPEILETTEEALSPPMTPDPETEEPTVTDPLQEVTPAPDPAPVQMPDPNPAPEITPDPIIEKPAPEFPARNKDDEDRPRTPQW